MDRRARKRVGGESQGKGVADREKGRKARNGRWW